MRLVGMDPAYALSLNPTGLYLNRFKIVQTDFVIQLTNYEAFGGSCYIPVPCVPVCGVSPPRHAYRCGNIRPIGARRPSFRLITTARCTLSPSPPFFSCRMP